MKSERILTSKTPSVECPFKTVGEYVWNKLKELDDHHVCVIDARTDERLTIGSLKSGANSIAVALLNRGVTKDDVFAFYGLNSIHHVVLRFASFFLGNTFMPLSPTFEKYEVEQEVMSAKANIILSDETNLHKFDGVFEDMTNNNPNNIKLVVVFDGNHDKYVTYDQLLAEGKGQTLEKIPHFDLNPEEDMFYLIHTSGSTGRPKCAKVPHRMFLNGVQGLSQFAGGSGKHVVSCAFPFGHVSGTNMAPTNIILGSTVVLYGDFDDELFLQSIEKYRINMLPLFPHYGRRIIEGDLADKYDLSSVKTMSTGGASFPGHISKALVDKYGVKFREAYGMTECLIVTTGSDDQEFIPGNVGPVAAGTQVKIVDITTGQSLGPNTDGEICVKSDKMFAGYLNNDKASEEAFDSQGWYHSGDIGHYDEKDRLFITDRLKEVVRIGVDNHYVNISPVEIEMFVLTHKAVAEVAVVGVNNTTGTHWPRAYVVLKEGLTATEADIQKFVKDTLAYTKQLKGGVVFVDAIKRTSIGKVDRKYYRNLVKDQVIN